MKLKNITQEFGTYVRSQREAKNVNDKSFSLRQVALRVGVEPSYLSKIERGEENSISEQLVKKLAIELDQDSNLMLAMIGKISSEIRDIILKRPLIFIELLKSLEHSPEHAILRIVREVKDGSW